MNRESFESAVSTFEHGGRFDKYDHVVFLGLKSGRSPRDIEDYMMQNAPPPAPSQAKIRDAIKFCQSNPLNPSDWRPAGGCPSRQFQSKKDKLELERQHLPIKLREFTHELAQLGQGMSSADIRSLSPVQIPSASPVGQAAMQLAALGHDPEYFIWAGTIEPGETGKKSKCPFSGTGIFRPLDLAAVLQSGKYEIPTHISLNPLTGRVALTTSGRQSYDCQAAIGAFRYALIEFDLLKDKRGLPSPEAVAIVGGLVKWSSVNENGFPVVSAVWTGNKSIHTVLRVPDLPQDIVTSDNNAGKQHYELAWKNLRQAFASSDDPAYRVDLNATNPAIHTRLAGARNPKTGYRAQLLYCAIPETF